MELFPEFISPIAWNMCEHLHYEIGIFQRATQRAKNYSPTIYRAGAAVVSTITSFKMINLRAVNFVKKLSSGF